MHVRLLTILLAILVAAGFAAPALDASADVVGQVDGGNGAPELEPAIAAAPAVLEVPTRHELRQIVAARTESHGRLPDVWVFRPPR